MRTGKADGNAYRPALGISGPRPAAGFRWIGAPSWALPITDDKRYAATRHNDQTCCAQCGPAAATLHFGFVIFGIRSMCRVRIF